MDKAEIEKNKEITLERKKLYKKYGYDQAAARNFILEKSLPLKKHEGYHQGVYVGEKNQ